jgi:TctA family transporter
MALTALASPERLGYMALGVLIGYAIGVLPALGGLAGLSLVMPFIYGLDQVSALAMLVGLVAVAATADTFSSILMGIPGSSASQATILDGFPMARRGEAARALSASFIASMIGGLIGAVILTGAVLIARPLILALGTAELFMLALLGLSMVGVLAGKSFAKGLIACGMGLALGMVGTAPATAEYRLDFGLIYLSDGLPLPVLVLAIFALPEIIDLARGGGTISRSADLGRGWIDGVRDIMRHWWLLLRTSSIGSVLGTASTASAWRHKIRSIAAPSGPLGRCAPIARHQGRLGRLPPAPHIGLDRLSTDHGQHGGQRHLELQRCCHQQPARDRCGQIHHRADLGQWHRFGQQLPAADFEYRECTSDDHCRHLDQQPSEHQREQVV